MKRPNIIYFFCDELRLDALGCYGNAFTDIKTPNIDEIAARGIRFTNCYCNSPVCVPSRMSQLTALYPKDTGVYHNEAALAPYQLSQSYTSIPQHLESFGYQCANFGKLHLPNGFQPFSHNDERGSSMSFAKGSCVRERLTPHKDFKSTIGGVWPKEEAYPPDEVCTNALTWMQKQRKPYFARISFLQPHTPVVVKEKFANLYKDAHFPESISYDEKASKFEQRFSQLIGLDSLSKQELHDMYVKYYGMVAWIDEQVGRITRYLKDTKQFENTILIFSADHGALRGENGCLAKQIYAPAAHQVPLCISYPKKITQPYVCEELCEGLDLAKTICGLLEIPVPEQFCGRDLIHEKEPAYVYAQIGYGEVDSYAFPAKCYGQMEDGSGWPQRVCIRSKQYRLDMNTKINGRAVTKEEEDSFFCDNERYPKENVNLIEDAQYADIIEDMKNALYHHLEHAREGDIQALTEIKIKMEAYHSHATS